jgi:hypothetical protein
MITIAEENFAIALQIAIAALENDVTSETIKRELGFTEEQLNELYETMSNDLAMLKTYS